MQRQPMVCRHQSTKRQTAAVGKTKMAHQQPLELEDREESWKKDKFPYFPSAKGRRGRAKEEFDREVEGWWGLRVTNLQCENLITEESCMCAVVRWTLRKGSNTLKGDQVNEPME